LTLFADLSLEGEHSMQKRLDPSQDALDSYEFTDEDLYELMKRGSLLRFGKRGSLLRLECSPSKLKSAKRVKILVELLIMEHLQIRNTCTFINFKIFWYSV
jgi:hypothetical protein